MFSGYAELDALPAEAFRNPALFVTPFDTLPENRAAGRANLQYQTGLEIGREWDTITIGAHTTWGAHMDAGMKHLSAYEGIGYHACTADLLRGFLDSPARLIVYRYTDHGISETVIKERAA